MADNACRTSLVVILNDGRHHAKALAPGTARTAFDGVKTGRTVEVRVVEHLDGNCRIGDILETGIARSLTEPAFGAGFLRVTAIDDTGTTNVNEFATEAVPLGAMYCIGHNENFGNHRANGLLTSPHTPRFRMGLAHSANETQGRRDDVNFEACIIRIVDEGGDRVFPHDVATVAAGETGNVLTNNTKPFRNVRLNDSGRISIAMENAADADVPFTKETINPNNRGLSGAGMGRGGGIRRTRPVVPVRFRGRLRVLASKRPSDTVGALAPCAGRRCENHGAVPTTDACRNRRGRGLWNKGAILTSPPIRASVNPSVPVGGGRIQRRSLVEPARNPDQRVSIRNPRAARACRLPRLMARRWGPYAVGQSPLLS